MSSLEYLCMPQAVRESAQQMLKEARQGSTGFRVNDAKIAEAARLTIEVTRRNYPDLKIPFHSRWEHFNVGGVQRVASLGLDSLATDLRARAKIDLVMISVLLDAGAGAAWSFEENGKRFSRSEGLAVASLRMFQAGAFSRDAKNNPLRVDAGRLAKVTVAEIAEGFQVSDKNPLQGLEGRAVLLKKLGHAIQQRSEFFANSGRPGGLYDYFQHETGGAPLRAERILRALLLSLQDMWPARSTVHGVNFGDMWSYEGRLVPFHKLSQWLSYSLIEPLEEGRLRVQGAEALTGLPEYRNGGLLLDTGVLELKDKAQFEVQHSPGDKLMIEWRALTVALLDEIGARVRQDLGKSEAELPLGKILQGGTWAAGRETAARLRNGAPPFQIQSDGTVF